ncbi:MAG: carboxymuconolactone decarboxylase family protein [Ignavibacteriae bacterium]|nr:carboxymuconolactone decarboxylase family protein [Ignavibacteriota bacterium]
MKHSYGPYALAFVTLVCSAAFAQTTHKHEPSLTLPKLEGRFGDVNSIRAWNYLPSMVEPLQQVGASLEDSKLPWRTRVMLATVASSLNSCLYCLCSTVNILKGEGLSEEEIVSLQNDIRKAKFSEKEKALLRVAEDVTNNLPQSSQSVRNAVKAGWTEEEVTQAIFVVSYFNMLNRIAVAFALPPDASHPFNPTAALPMIQCR